MTTSLVITAIGADRPGIVNDLTEVLLKTDLNIEDSRMTVLGGEFAVMLLVTGSTDSIESIRQQAGSISDSLNLSLLIKATHKQDNRNNESHFNISVEGMDNPGIVHKLTRYLSQQHINIVNMQTNSGHAPHTGTPMFTVNIRVDIPTKLDIEQIKNDFTELCDELNMDTEFNSL